MARLASAVPVVTSTISGADFGYNEYLSPAVSATLPNLMQYVQALVAAVERGDALEVTRVLSAVGG